MKSIFTPISKVLKHILLLVTCIVLSACSVMGIRKHSPNYKNTRELQAIKQKFFIGPIVGADGKSTQTSNFYNRNEPKRSDVQIRLESSWLPCRLTTFEMPVNMTVSDYVRDAFQSELDAASIFDLNGKEISVLVKELESDTSSVSAGVWKIEIEYKVDARIYSIRTITPFESAFAGDTACRNTAAAFEDAVSANFIEFFRQWVAKG